MQLSSDELLLQRIGSLLKFNRRYKVAGPHSEMVFSIFANSVDKTCVLNEYKKHNYTDRIPTEGMISKLMESSGRRPSSESDVREIMKDALSGYIFIVSALSCSNKFDAIAEYVYEMLMTQGILYRAFEDEPQLKEISDIVRCGNRYAIMEDVIDSEVYNLKTNLDEDAEAKCSQLTNMMKGKLNEYKSEGVVMFPSMDGDCYTNYVNTQINLALKYLLLVQVKMTPAQRKQERQNFIKDNRDSMTAIVPCIAVASTVENEIQ